MSTLDFLKTVSKKPIETISDLWAEVNSNLAGGGKVHLASKSLNGDVFINISDNTTDIRMTKDKYKFRQIALRNNLCSEVNNSIYVCYEKEYDVDEDLILCVEISIVNLLYSRLSSIRNNVVEASYRSKDFNSFSHRLIDGFARNYFNVEGCSMYALDPRNGFLRLAATTGLNGGIEKKDVFYPDADGNRPFSVLQTGRMKCFQGGAIVDVDRYREKLSASAPYAILYVPIKRMHQNEKSTDRQIGLLKLLNPHRRIGGDRPTEFHELDRAELNFFAETVSVLSQNYNRALEAEDNFERTIHGFRTDLESSADHLDTLGHLVFGENINEIDFDRPFGDGPFSNGDIHRLHEDALAFLDDLSFQIEKSRLLVHERSELIQHFHAEVLAPVLKMVGSMIVSNSSPPPDINKLIEVGSLNLPNIVGSRSGYISVLRNLLENSVKYRKPNAAPKIEITFKTGVEFVEIHVRDYGIGIKKNEERFLFVEGFRSVGARRASFKGAGIGLSYSRDVMRIMGGELEYHRVVDGMKFVMKAPRQKTASVRLIR